MSSGIGFGMIPSTVPIVNVGTNPDDGTGDTPHDAISKLNTAINWLFYTGAADAPPANPDDQNHVAFYRGYNNNTFYVWDPIMLTWFTPAGITLPTITPITGVGGEPITGAGGDSLQGAGE